MKDPDWQMLFLEFWARAVREPDVLERYVTVRTGLRDQIAIFIEEAPAPGTVPPTLLGDVPSLLLAPSRP